MTFEHCITSGIMSCLQTTKFRISGRRAELHKELQKLQTTKKRKFQKSSTVTFFFFFRHAARSRTLGRDSGRNFVVLAGFPAKTTKLLKFPKFLADFRNFWPRIWPRFRDRAASPKKKKKKRSRSTIFEICVFLLFVVYKLHKARNDFFFAGSELYGYRVDFDGLWRMR